MSLLRPVRIKWIMPADSIGAPCKGLRCDSRARQASGWSQQLVLVGLFFAVLCGYAAALADPLTHDLKGEVVDEQNKPIAGAVCTLTSERAGVLPELGISVTTDEQGQFAFPSLIPEAYDLTCAAIGRQTVVKQGIQVTEEQSPFIEVVSPAEVIVKQRVEVREQAPSVAQRATAPPAVISAPQLINLPIVQQKFRAALPLVPGVVRTPDGKINIKGSVENQGVLLVDSAETVDPVTGSFSIDVPIDAVESLDVFKSAYRAEYGRFSGGLTTVQTKPPSDRWHYELNDFLPTPRIKSGHIVGVADDAPRFYLTGPIWGNKLNFSESLTYEIDKQPVRGLAWPHNETKVQSLTSFTSFQFILSPQHLLTVNGKIFPLRRQFADINSLIPQPASSDYGQRGISIGATDRYLFNSGGVLTTLFQVTQFDSYAHGQGPLDMLVTPDGWGGNFFNSWARNSHQEEILQTYQFARWEWTGKHDVKVGTDFIHRGYSGFSHSRPVLLTRRDGTLAERIDFQGPGALTADDTEVALFGEDHWAATDHLAFDLGLRYSGQTLGEPAAFAPRFGTVYSPGSGGKTIFRGGVGFFYDRTPLLAGDFTDNPTRVLTYFDALGNPLGPPIVLRNSYIKRDDKGRLVTPSRHRLDSTPYNVTWNLEADREIRPDLLVRFSYLSSRTFNEFIIDPLVPAGGLPTLLLSNTGGSRYHELESTLRWRARENADVNFSYVWSLARGSLNSMSQVYVPFEEPVIRPNFYGDLPSNVPNRFVTWATFRLPWEFRLSPVADLHSGFPYSVFNEFQNYVGAPNGHRFPEFFSLDLKVSKDFTLPLIPLLRNHKIRAAVAVYNLTNHSNPRDIYSNIQSPNFGHFVGFQHRLYETFFDIVY